MRVLKQFLLWTIGLAPAQSQTNEAERDCLARHAAGRQRLAEIGVYQAVTTRRLREAMAPDGVLLAVDPFAPGRLGFSYDRLIARGEARKVKNGQVRWLRMTGMEAAHDPAVDELGGIDFIFIDGDHSYDGLRADWEAWSPRVIPGGIVALHDSRSYDGRDIESAGSVQFTRDVIARDPRFSVVDTVDSLTVLKRGVSTTRTGI
jgi:predicted O-methyltransferase YrrM